MHVAGWAKRFLFDGAQLDRPISSLSGGEQARVLIARLMLQPADLLLLDEPTNDLDIPTLEVLEESLIDFPGALVLVTHDRYLLDRVSTFVLGLDGQGGAQLYADYWQWEGAERKGAPRMPPKPPPNPHPPKSALLSGSPRVGANGDADPGSRAGARVHPRRNALPRRGLGRHRACKSATRTCNSPKPVCKRSTPAGPNWKPSSSNAAGHAAGTAWASPQASSRASPPGPRRQGETDLGRKVGERASSLIRALPAKTAVGEDDCLANDVVAEAPAAEGEPVLTLAGGYPFQFLDVLAP